jgi:hypothetical protein
MKLIISFPIISSYSLSLLSQIQIFSSVPCWHLQSHVLLEQKTKFHTNIK